jgi:hypothetical protein
MPNNIECSATVEKENTTCGNCNAKIGIQATSESTPNQDAPSTSPNILDNWDMSKRLEKALRRTELLSFAAAGLGIAILVVILMIEFGFT